MNDLQNTFDACSALYKKCYDNVKAMACDIAAVLEEQGVDFDPKITTGKFDIVLQYSLLQIAVADFDFDVNEMIFIRDITEQGDFLNYVNSIAKTGITWNGLLNSSVNDIRKFLRDIEGEIEELSEEFVAVFATCDKVTREYNYVADLEKYIVSILAGLMTMDGNITKNEASTSTVIGRAINKIKQLKKQ